MRARTLWGATQHEHICMRDVVVARGKLTREKGGVPNGTDTGERDRLPNSPKNPTAQDALKMAVASPRNMNVAKMNIENPLFVRIVSTCE